MKKVLLVEDEKSIADVSSRLIKSIDSSLEVVVAEDSEVAMEMLNKGDIDLAFIDGTLKDGYTGPTVARVANGLRVPFIVTSSNLDAKEKFDRYEPRAYLNKPYNLDTFSDHLRKFYSL